MDDLENQVASMEETFKTRVVTLEETFRQTFAEFRQTMTEEFAKVHREQEKSPALSVAEDSLGVLHSGEEGRITTV
jgi:lipoate-protein ligase A